MDRVNKVVINRFDKVPGFIGSVPIYGLFDEPTKTVDTLSGEVVTTAPAFTVESKDAIDLGIAYGTEISIKNVLYMVAEAPDSFGLVRLTLTYV